MIKPVLKYPGAKWRLAEWIISHFPAHQHYVEPYFGSGAVFFNKTPAKHEVINDLSGDVVNLFRVIREDGEQLAALIEMTAYARGEYELSYQACDDPTERARRFLVRCWQSHGFYTEVAKHGWSIGAVGNAGIKRAYAWDRLPSVLRLCAGRLIQAHIAQDDALNLLRIYRRTDTLIYADPPYPHGTRKRGIYTEDRMTDADHAALLDALDALDAHPGPVVLSGYHCALYDDRLKHWHTREKQAQAEKGNTRTEVLWLNQTCVDRLGFFQNDT